MSEVERDIWMIQERRISDHDNKIADAHRGIQSVEHELRQLIERINMGVSPTQNKILEKQSAIELAISDLGHKMELNLRTISDDFDKQLSQVTVTQTEQGNSLDLIKKVFIGGIILGVLTAGTKILVEHFATQVTAKSNETKGR